MTQHYRKQGLGTTSLLINLLFSPCQLYFLMMAVSKRLDLPSKAVPDTHLLSFVNTEGSKESQYGSDWWQGIWIHIRHLLFKSHVHSGGRKMWGRFLRSRGLLGRQVNGCLLQVPLLIILSFSIVCKKSCVFSSIIHMVLYFTLKNLAYKSIWNLF